MFPLATALWLAVQPGQGGVRFISPTVDEVLEQVVGGSDRDFDGAISKSEAMEHDIIRARGNGHAMAVDPTFKPNNSWMILPIFEELDTDRDGKVSLVDLLPAMRARIMAPQE